METLEERELIDTLWNVNKARLLSKVWLEVN